MNVPELFFDRLDDLTLRNGIIRMTLVSVSGKEPQPVQRLLVPLDTFIAMTQAQNTMRQRLEDAGIVRPAAQAVEVSPGETRIAAETTRTVQVTPRLRAVPAGEPPAGPSDPPAARSPNFED